MSWRIQQQKVRLDTNSTSFMTLVQHDIRNTAGSPFKRPLSPSP